MASIAALAACCALSSAASAGPTVDRIRAEGVVRCGGTPRPGLADLSPDGGRASGLYLDLCRAVGAALLAPEGRIEFSLYSVDAARIGDGRDDLAFVDGSEMLDGRLAGKTVLGPPVVFVSTGVMVPGDSSVKTLADLSGRSVCFFQGAEAHRALEAFLATGRLDVARMPFTETGEMNDAFLAGKCEAVAGEMGDLAALRLMGRAKGAASRILPEPLATGPVFALTPAGDAQWSAIVAFVIAVLQRAELKPGPWTAGGAEAAAPNGADLGLAEGWAERVLAAAGPYADIYARNLGDRSRLGLPRGPNAPVEAGGWFVTPFRR